MSNITDSDTTTPFLTPQRLSPLTIGTWVSLVLVTAELVLLVKYFASKARRGDCLFVKLGVLVNWVTDLAGTVACCAATYLYTVLYWGNIEELQEMKWPFMITIFSVGVVTAVSQVFMIMRYWQLSKNHIAFAFLFLFFFASVTGIIGTGVLVVLSRDMQDKLVTIFLLMALSASCVGTGLTTVLLFTWKLTRKDENPVLSKRRNRFPNFISGLIDTGALTALLTIAGSATSFGKLRDTMVWVAVAFVQPRVYSCTMIFILVQRPEPVDAAITIPGMYITRDPRTLPAPPKTPVMDDTDAFRLTKKRIELHNRDFDSDSSSDVSRNLNDELKDIENGAGLRRASLSSYGDNEHAIPPPRSATPSEYPASAPESPRPATTQAATPRFVTPRSSTAF